MGLPLSSDRASAEACSNPDRGFPNLPSLPSAASAEFCIASSLLLSPPCRLSFVSGSGELRFDHAGDRPDEANQFTRDRDTSGATVRRGAITKTGNALARTSLVEAAWTYRFPARITQIIRDRLKALPEPIRAVAWKAQVRLSARYRALIARGKSAPIAIVAVARELVGFIWAIARMVEPKFT